MQPKLINSPRVSGEPEEVRALEDGSIPQALLETLVFDSIESFNQELDANVVTHMDLRDLFPKGTQTLDDTSSLETQPYFGISKLKKNVNLVPILILAIALIQGTVFNRPLVALLDTGSNQSHIQQRVLPHDIKFEEISRPVVGLTGKAVVTKQVTLSNMLFPELSRTLRINDSFKCNVMENESYYDIILGRDFLAPVGLDIKNSTQEVVWMDHSIPFRPKNALEDPYTLYNDCLDALAAEILEAKYEKVDGEEVAELQKHLPPH